MPEVTKEEKFKIYGDVDRTKEGKLKSDYPSWMFPQQKEELEESVRHKEYQLDNDLIPPTEKNFAREGLQREKKRLDEINESTPRFSDVERDQICKVWKSLGKKIGELMFRRSDMEKGLADAHQEAKRISEPCVVLDELEISFIRSCEIGISSNAKVSRGGAEKAWKIAARILDENSNTEILRRP